MGPWFETYAALDSWAISGFISGDLSDILGVKDVRLCRLCRKFDRKGTQLERLSVADLNCAKEKSWFLTHHTVYHGVKKND